MFLTDTSLGCSITAAKSNFGFCGSSWIKVDVIYMVITQQHQQADEFTFKSTNIPVLVSTKLI